MTYLNLSSSFKKRVINTFGHTGQAWLTNLPALIAKSEKRFNLQIEEIFEHQSVNFTAHAKKNNGTEIVIKICVSSSGASNEINALEFMRGDGIVQLLESDNHNGILLLEKLKPGKMLTTIRNDIEAISITADIMKKICKPLANPHVTQTTAQWFDRLSQPIELPSNFPTALINKAKQIALELHQNMGETVLLHGDLHHFNILSSERQPWLAIDPKGVIGEREYEVGALLRNPVPNIVTTMDTRKILANRVDLLAELLGFDRQRMCAWGFAQAVLAAIWCVNDKTNDWNLFIKCAEALSHLS